MANVTMYYTNGEHDIIQDVKIIFGERWIDFERMTSNEWTKVHTCKRDDIREMVIL